MTTLPHKTSRQCVLLRFDGSMEEVECAPGTELRDTCTHVTQMSLSDLREPVISLSKAPFDSDQRVVTLTVMACDTFQFLDQDQYNQNATTIVIAGNSAHRKNDLLVRGDCLVTANMSGYLKAGSTRPLCSGCHIDLTKDDVLQLLCGQVSKNITNNRCKVHRDKE